MRKSPATLKLALSTALVSASLVAARCSHDIAARGKAQHQALMAERDAGELFKRQSSPDLASESALTNPQQECSYYNYAPVSSILYQYPPIWEVASIVPGDAEATAAYNAIINDPQFPNQITPKGTPEGDFSGVNYNGTDPDCWWTWSKCDTPKQPGIPNDIFTCPEPSTWGLTYDDGPNCTHNAFYDFLQTNQYTASFFFIGSNVMDWPLQAQRGVQDGHEIGVHTWSHRYSTALTSEQFFAELWYTRKAIKAVLGITPLTWRPPFGDVDDRIRFIATKMNLTTVIWDNDMFDWQIQNPANPGGLPTASIISNYDQMYSKAASGHFNTQGTIVLTHELNDDTMDLAMTELPSIAANFKHIVPVATVDQRAKQDVQYVQFVRHEYDFFRHEYDFFRHEYDFFRGSAANVHGQRQRVWVYEHVTQLLMGKQPE
ncbi:MAG: hypothetical protein CYPHOPRED_005939 [Cyphobasidiales sp. Tagirdzhanova-0007]|nr:MAG: hypothetical protein CYPHOPRED_005939 [Cyphobasidiales sp. Tagirdzhanova-0007]